jgi:hypothetical protein
MGVGVEVAVLSFGIGSGVRGWGFGVVEVVEGRFGDHFGCVEGDGEGM